MTKRIISIFLKTAFFAVAFFVILFTFSLVLYFAGGSVQKNADKKAYNIWHCADKTRNEKISLLEKQNKDFVCWIKIPDTNINYPVYQTDNDDYYMYHNGRGNLSRYGALFMSSKDNICENTNDKNFVIYGNNMKDGQMFGDLKKYRNLNFYKKNPVLTLDFYNEQNNYAVYSVMVLNSDKKDDNGYLYNVYKSGFFSGEDFDKWCDEAKSRSLIDTSVKAEYGDSILTLITCADDFENARLVVMAKRIYSQNDQPDTYNAKINEKIRYPKKWYDERKLDFPY